MGLFSNSNLRRTDRPQLQDQVPNPIRVGNNPNYRGYDDNDDKNNQSMWKNTASGVLDSIGGGKIGKLFGGGLLPNIISGLLKIKR